MNHSRAFWAVRNQYAEEMRALWGRGFTGEGLWGRGALLATGAWETDAVRPGEVLPEHLCGGTYRSRGGKKRKAKKVVSYQEQKERRILKKFGANGVALGEDTEAKKRLEKGRTVAAKPRVAGSARGRELRAAAALARFDQQQKKEQVAETTNEDDGDDDETSSGEDYEDDGDTGAGQAGAVDIDGKRLLDGKGRGMVKVCGDESTEDQDAKNEALELLGFGAAASNARAGAGAEAQATTTPQPGPATVSDKVPVSLTPKFKSESKQAPPDRRYPAVSRLFDAKDAPSIPEPSNSGGICPVCSFVNDKTAPTCAMCANVLHLREMAGAWACSGQACRGSSYRNAADCGVCGVCGERKPVA